MSSTGLGIDLGNSNTTVAVYDGHRISYLHIDDEASDRRVMPTATYINRDYLPATGQEAVNAYLRDNTGRVIKLERANLGEIVISMGEMDRDHYQDRDRTFRAKIHTLVDKDQPGRLFRGLKGYLGTAPEVRFEVFEKRMKIEALYTPVLKRLKEVLDPHGHRYHIGRPVTYAGPEGHANDYALTKMFRSAGYAGMTDPCFFPEPVAAALSYFHSENIDFERALVFDFGGGTLDMSILHPVAGGLEVMANHGVPKAGDKIDQTLLKEFVFPLLGKGLQLKKTGADETYPFPFEDFEDDILNWQNTHFMNQPKFLEIIARAVPAHEDDGERLNRLLKLIRSNSAFRLVREVEAAKIRLSHEEETGIHVEDLGINVRISRGDMTAAIHPFLADIEAGVRRVLAKAGSEAGDIQRVICTGGSSQIPAVRELLNSIFPGRLVEFDVFTSIAAGLAIASHHGYTWTDDGSREFLKL